MYPSLAKQFLINSGLAGLSVGTVKGAVALALQVGTIAPSSFWQTFAMLLLTSLMTMGKWYFDDRKASRANSETLVEVIEKLDLYNENFLLLRKEFDESQKRPARRHTTGRLR